jgi:hypothetical protein
MGLLLANVAVSAPPGFVKSTIPLEAPPVGLAFDGGGKLYALEGASFGSNRATLRTILADGTFGGSFPVVGDDPSNFFAGSMAYDPVSDELLVSDNTADGRLYAVSTTGAKQTLASGIAGIAGVAVRSSGEIFVSTAPFGAAGELLQIDRASGSATPVLGGLGYGAGLIFDAAGDLIVQDADTATFRGRLQRLPITETPAGLEFGPPATLLDDMQSSAGVTLDSEGDIFTTGSGGLFSVAGWPLAERAFDTNGNAFQFATAIAFGAGARPFERFSGPDGGRLAYMADFGFAMQDSFITLLAAAQPGDYNGDGSVSEADYSTWQGGFGSTSDLAADGNGDGVVDTADYVLWRKSFIAEAGRSTTPAWPAPEPGAAMLVVLGGCTVNFRRRDRTGRAAGAPRRARRTAGCPGSCSGCR